MKTSHIAPPAAISGEAITFAATNAPSMSDLVGKIGDVEYPVLHLPYKDYLEFLGGLEPMLKGLGVGILSGEPMEGAMSIAALLKSCGEAIPTMACIVCRQTRPETTVEELVSGKATPFDLAKLVLLQIERNNMIKDIADFFVQSLRLVKQGKAALDQTQ